MLDRTYVRLSRVALLITTTTAILLLGPPVAFGTDVGLGEGPGVGTFDQLFTGDTLRFDYYHSGVADEEHISLDRIRAEGPWPGRRQYLLDENNLGKYLFVVVDLDRNVPIYSSGFSSIYGEWETTGEARSGVWRSLHESQRFPEPKRPVQLVLKKRQRDGSFREIFAMTVDPAHRSVHRGPLVPRGEVWPVLENGPPSQKVDLLILGDGYTEAELGSYREHARAVADSLLSFPPFSDRKDDFNVWAIDVASAASGISRPRAGYWNETPLGLSYNSFDSERYMLTLENRRLREIAALAPYDALILIANDEKYGGGGIYNLYSTAPGRSAQMPYLIVHEFGHAFVGLGDEYYTSSVSYEDFNPPGTEPWEPNITALLDPEQLKWADLVEADTPIPTPWNQDKYDETSTAFQRQRSELRRGGASEGRMEEYFAEVKRVTAPMLRNEPHFDSIGAFEGAGYEAKGLYRPAADCIMFTRNPDNFCRVCSRAIERLIDSYVE